MDLGTVLRDGRTAEIREQLLPHITQVNCLFAERRTKTIELCLTMSSLRRDLPHGYWAALIQCGDLDMKKSAADQHAHSGDTLRNLTAHNYGQLPAHFSALHHVQVSGANSAITNRLYIFGHDLIAQHWEPGDGVDRVCYYGYDGHGSVRFLLSPPHPETAAVSVSDTYTYDAFGILIASTGTTVNDYRYAGEQCDPDLGLSYNRARYLNLNTGRFWAMDSFEGCCGNPISQHKYAYAHNSPVANIANIDPSGNESIAAVFTVIQVNSILAEAVPVAAGATRAAICGPDVTDAVNNTLKEVDDTFKGNTWTAQQKLAACKSLDTLPQGTIAWDMDITVPTPTTTGPCKDTATFRANAENRRCYKTSAINYALYGKMSKRCYDAFGKGPPGSRWSLEFAIGGAQINKWGFRGDFSDEANQAFAFISYGFGAGLKYRGKDYAITSCRPSSETSKAERFRWKWLPNKKEF